MKNVPAELFEKLKELKLEAFQLKTKLISEGHPQSYTWCLNLVAKREGFVNWHLLLKACKGIRK